MAYVDEFGVCLLSVYFTEQVKVEVFELLKGDCVLAGYLKGYFVQIGFCSISQCTAAINNTNYH